MSESSISDGVAGGSVAPVSQARDRLKEIGPYLPHPLIESVAQRGGDVGPWIEQVDGSLLFVDVSGFTAMSERLARLGHEGAELLTTVINTFFGQMLDIAASLGGANLKFGGDALLLLFTGDQHASRAALAGFRMQDATERFSVWKTIGYRAKLRMSAGMHSGKFWMATAGSPGERMQHLILGKQASLSAKAEGIAVAGQVVATPESHRLMESNPAVEPAEDCLLLLEPPAISGDWVNTDGITLESDVIARLDPFLPPAVRHGQSVRAESEHRNVGVVFVKVTGVNELVDRSGSQLLLEELQNLVCDAVVLAGQHGGYMVANDIDASGIKLILTFGAPVAHEEDLPNAARFALALMEARNKSQCPFDLQVGVNAGFIFAGDVGAPIRREYTVMGDAVNLSARLMAHAPKNSILVSDSFAGNLGGVFELQSLKPILVKGKRAPIPVSLLISEQGEAPQEHGEHRASFVGREKEFNHLLQTAARAEKGERAAVFIEGPTGIGKSRLVEELSRKLESESWRVIRGLCLSHTGNIPLSPWRAVASHIMGLSPQDSTEARTKRAVQVINALVPEAAEVASLLNPLLGTEIPGTDLSSSLSPGDALRRFRSLIASLVTAVASDSPVALVFEDLHWADPSSVHLLHAVIEDAAPARLMVVSTSRPSDEDLLRELASSSDLLTVSELDNDAVDELVDQLVESGKTSRRMKELIEDRAHGNPLYVEELTRSLEAMAAAGRGAGQLAGEDPGGDIVLPDRIQAVVMSRIDALRPPARDLLRAVSVVGRYFDLNTASAVAGNESGSVQGLLRELITQQILEPAEEDPVDYQFRHALAQEVAYGSLPYRRRRELHGMVAEHLELAQPAEHGENVGLLAYHFLQSGDHTKSVRYSIQAATQAQDVFAHDEAVTNYQRALSVSGGKDPDAACQRSFLGERIGDVLELSGDHRGARDWYTRALRHWRSAERNAYWAPRYPDQLEDQVPLRARESSLRLKSAVALEREGRYDDAMRLVGMAESALPPRVPRIAARTAVTRCVVHFRRGEYADSLHYGKRALRAANRFQANDLVAYCHDMIGSSLVEQGKLKQALSHRLQATELYEELHNVPAQATAHNNLATCYQQLGELPEASEQYALALQACQRLGDPTRVAIVTHNMAEVLLTQGRLDEAELHFKEVVAGGEEDAMAQALKGLSLVNLSRVYQRRRIWEHADPAAREAVAVLRRSGAQGLMLEAQVQQAAVQAEHGDPEAARRAVRSTLEKVREANMQLLEARSLLVEAVIASRRGDQSSAMDYASQSATLAGRIGARFEQAQAVRATALISRSAAGRDHFNAHERRAVERAITMFTRLGAQGEVDETTMLLS